MHVTPHHLLRKTFLLACFLFVLSACGSEAIALRGVVRDAYTDAPIPSAVVQIGSSKTMTAADGTYSIDQWLRRQTLSVSMGDYETFALDLSKRSFPQTLTAADTVVDVVIRPNVIRGVVTDAWSNQPLAGVVLQAGPTRTLSPKFLKRLRCKHSSLTTFRNLFQLKRKPQRTFRSLVAR